MTVEELLELPTIKGLKLISGIRKSRCTQRNLHSNRR